MKEQTMDKIKSLSPMRLADDANRGFVRMVQYLGRVASFDFHSKPELSHENGSCAAQSENQNYLSDIESTDATKDRIIRNNEFYPMKQKAHDRKKKIRNLFSDNESKRLSAVRWVGQHRYTEALPLLEGILAIETHQAIHDLTCKVILMLREEIEDRGGD